MDISGTYSLCPCSAARCKGVCLKLFLGFTSMSSKPSTDSRSSPSRRYCSALSPPLAAAACSGVFPAKSTKTLSLLACKDSVVKQLSYNRKRQLYHFEDVLMVELGCKVHGTFAVEVRSGQICFQLLQRREGNQMAHSGSYEQRSLLIRIKRINISPSPVNNNM